MSDHAARWEARYGGPGTMFGEAPNAFLASQAHRFQPGSAVLVPGDGEGRNGVWLAGLGLEVTTIDLAGAGVAKARALAASRGVRIDARQADLADWAWPERAFDAVVSIYLHLPGALRSRVHQGVRRALRTGGLFVLEAFRPGQLAFQTGGPAGRGSGGPSEPDLLTSAASLRQDFPDADALVLEEVETDLAEGGHHVGRAAVVRAVLRTM